MLRPDEQVALATLGSLTGGQLLAERLEEARGHLELCRRFGIRFLDERDEARGKLEAVRKAQNRAAMQVNRQQDVANWSAAGRELIRALDRILRGEEE